MRCFEVLREELEKLVTGVFHSSSSPEGWIEIHFRPSVHWELREEYFRIYYQLHHVYLSFVDPVDSGIYSDTVLVVNLRARVANYSLDVESYFADGELFKFRRAIGRDEEVRMQAYIDCIGSFGVWNSDVGLWPVMTYAMSKWLTRPENVFLMRLMMARYPEKFVSRMAGMLGCRNLYVNLRAAAEITGSL